MTTFPPSSERKDTVYYLLLLQPSSDQAGAYVRIGLGMTIDDKWVNAAAEQHLTII